MDYPSLQLGAVLDQIKQLVHLLKIEDLLKSDLEKVATTLSSIPTIVNDPGEKGRVDRQLKDWRSQLEDAIYDAEDNLDYFRTEFVRRNRKKQGRWFQPYIFRSSFLKEAARQMKDMLAWLGRTAEEGKKFELPLGKKGREYTTSRPDESNVVGREDDKENMVKVLLSDQSDKEGDVPVTSIVGMGGLGKTTLAQLVYNDERVISRFELRLWVCVSDNFDLSRILREMINSVSEKNYNTCLLPITVVESRVVELIAGKRFLLVLDDVWTEGYWEWEPLKLLLKRGGKGSKVLVTTRSAAVSFLVGTQDPYFLPALPETDSWRLFSQIAFAGENVPIQLEKIGKDIVRKCQGLPLAVTTIASLLRGNVDIDKWRSIAAENRLKADNILVALQLSYDHLPTYLKCCFTYCSIFPKGHKYDKEELIKLWIAEGFIEFTPSNRPEEIGSEYFNKLLRASFFQPSSAGQTEERYSMHDLIHDLALFNSGSRCCPLENRYQLCELSETTRRVFLPSNDVEEAVLRIMKESNKLRTLLSPPESMKKFGQALEKMFRTLTLLRVLDLSSSMILKLPKSIEKLKLLRYLNLSGNEIKVLPHSLCNLYNLQTLKLLQCPQLSHLPKDLAHLTNLRYLELDELFWYKASALPPRMGSLTRLQNLHAFPVSREKGYRIEELKAMADLTGKLHILNLENAVNAWEAKLNEKGSLRELVLEWSDGNGKRQDEAADEKVLEGLQPHTNLKRLKIVGYSGTRFPTWVRGGILENLVTASLEDCSKCRILSLDLLPLLAQLRIKGMDELEEWSHAEFPSLHQLEISYCPKLRKLPFVFPRLQHLMIERCNSLKALPVTPSLLYLALVDNSVLEDWNEVTVQRGSENGEDQLVTQPSLYGLLELKLSGCPKLRSLPEIKAAQKLEISKCELLTSLPSS